MKKKISGWFRCVVEPIRFPDEVALLYFPLDPKTRERRGRPNFQMDTETWPAIRDRLPLRTDSLATIEGYLREGQRANICDVERSFEIDATPYEDVPLISEEVHLQGHNGTFRVTSVNDVARTLSAEHTNTLFLVEDVPWSTISSSRPEDHEDTPGNS
jgi:hypothetical protein